MMKIKADSLVHKEQVRTGSVVVRSQSEHGGHDSKKHSEKKEGAHHTVVAHRTEETHHGKSSEQAVEILER